jgi:hypothetical protein
MKTCMPGWKPTRWTSVTCTHYTQPPLLVACTIDASHASLICDTTKSILNTRRSIYMAMNTVWYRGYWCYCRRWGGCFLWAACNPATHKTTCGCCLRHRALHRTTPLVCPLTLESTLIGLVCNKGSNVLLVLSLCDAPLLSVIRCLSSRILVRSSLIEIQVFWTATLQRLPRAAKSFSFSKEVWVPRVCFLQ